MSTIWLKTASYAYYLQKRVSKSGSKSVFLGPYLAAIYIKPLACSYVLQKRGSKRVLFVGHCPQIRLYRRFQNDHFIVVLCETRDFYRGSFN